nr:MAG TPA: hypothetical protein [Caudoviricetes sp.]
MLADYQQSYTYKDLNECLVDFHNHSLQGFFYPFSHRILPLIKMNYGATPLMVSIYCCLIILSMLLFKNY